MMPEWLSFGLNLTIIGTVVVFVVLSIIAGVIALVRRLDDRWEEREKAGEAAAMAKDQNIDSTTLIILAAAAATMIQGRFYIRTVRRLLPRTAIKGPWSVQGRAVLLGSHAVPKKH
jgi:Na+-transporting methylmalonyl-CoA/oxaloacetate decarboxylase gamma subunit